MKSEVLLIVKACEDVGYRPTAEQLREYGISPRDARNAITELNKRNKEVEQGTRNGKVIPLFTAHKEKEASKAAQDARFAEELKRIQFLKELQQKYEDARF